jgi:hypothetical protein
LPRVARAYGFVEPDRFRGGVETAGSRSGDERGGVACHARADGEDENEEAFLRELERRSEEAIRDPSETVSWSNLKAER